MSSFQLNDCSYKISTSPDAEYPRVLTNITLKATHPELGNIGSLSAIRILRYLCRGGSFLGIMDYHSDELHKFSIALFDKFGHVRPWLVEKGSRRGIGCWGKELNDGELIYVLDMSVKEKYRNQGLGSEMLEKLVTSDLVQAGDTFMCWPTPVGIRDKTEWRNVRQKQVSFFRKNEFRRIGRTGFFGYSPDPAHPSRSVPITADADEQGEGFDSSADDALTDAEVAVKYPIHLTIVNNKTPAIADFIRTHYVNDPASIHKPDANGFTPIHVAMRKMRPYAVAVLLALGVADDLRNAHTAEGVTPLEGLAREMQDTREFEETMLDGWEGYSAEQLACEFLAKEAMGMPTMANSLEAYIEKRKWACTCGMCAGGWLSRRMRFRLQSQAHMTIDMMHQQMDQFKKGVVHDDLSMLWDNVSEYLPPQLHQSLFKTFYVGYQSIFSVISHFLLNTELPLSKQAIAELVPGLPGVTFYIQKGGKIEYAFDATMGVVKEQSPLGDGSFEDLWEGDDNEYTGLPECHNDLEFDLVRRMIGLDPKLIWGPYRSQQDEEEEEDVVDQDDQDEDEEEEEDDDGMDGVAPGPRGSQVTWVHELLRRVETGELAP